MKKIKAAEHETETDGSKLRGISAVTAGIIGLTGLSPPYIIK